MDFNDLPFFDNHTHSLDSREGDITATWFLSHYYHGCNDLFDPGGAEASGMSDTLQSHLKDMGVVHTLVANLADLYGCPPSIGDIVAERNRRTRGGVLPYAKFLYKDANIVGTVLDSDRPVGQEVVDSIPCKVHRLYQMDKRLFALMKTRGSYGALKTALLDGVAEGISSGAYSGVKSHLSELYTNDISPCGDTDGERSYQAARAGDKNAMQQVYCAILTSVMVLCKELDTNIHIHTGITGMSSVDGDPKINGVVKFGLPTVSDPLLLAPFLRNRDFRHTKVVLLHGGYPWMRGLAILAHMFPNVYADMSATLPWASFALDQYFEEILAYAPHSKIILGTGQHGVPETAWLGARIAKQSLKRVLAKAVKNNLICGEQAENTARKVLYLNAQTLFGS